MVGGGEEACSWGLVQRVQEKKPLEHPEAPVETVLIVIVAVFVKLSEKNKPNLAAVSAGLLFCSQL